MLLVGWLRFLLPGFKGRLLWQPLHVHNSVASECSLIIFCLLLQICENPGWRASTGRWGDMGEHQSSQPPTLLDYGWVCASVGWQKLSRDRGQCDMYRTHSGRVLSNLKRTPRAKCLSSAPRLRQSGTTSRNRPMFYMTWHWEWVEMAKLGWWGRNLFW